jgi:hypothetical protein
LMGATFDVRRHSPIRRRGARSLSGAACQRRRRIG